MTSANGAKKFEERLKKISVPYEIKVGIIGKEKVDFITSARVAFNPSTVESYGMAFYEQIIQLPTFCLENQRWTKNFGHLCFFETNKKQMAKDVLDAYERFQTASAWYGNGNGIKKFSQLEDQVFHRWNECFNEFKPKQSNSSTAKILDFGTVKYREFIESLGRNLICIDDTRSVLTNKHKYRVIYTDNDSYLTKDPTFEPIEEIVGSDLFEML
jgi:hypothetical protein